MLQSWGWDSQTTLDGVHHFLWLCWWQSKVNFISVTFGTKSLICIKLSMICNNCKRTISHHWCDEQRKKKSQWESDLIQKSPFDCVHFLSHQVTPQCALEFCKESCQCCLTVSHSKESPTFHKKCYKMVQHLNWTKRVDDCNGHGMLSWLSWWPLILRFLLFGLIENSFCKCNLEKVGPLPFLPPSFSSGNPVLVQKKHWFDWINYWLTIKQNVPNQPLDKILPLLVQAIVKHAKAMLLLLVQAVHCDGHRAKTRSHNQAHQLFFKAIMRDEHRT